ncbi:MAG TPA: HAD family phosphatase [Firmicutes bacterium]|nr:HAD family phosphatase [Bacillota bacterium]
MLKAALFDMDGLMFDTERLCMRAWDYAGERLGLGKTGYMVLRTLGVNPEAADAIWREEFGSRYDRERLRAYTREYRARYFAENPVPVKPGLKALLSFLGAQGVRMAVVSSTPAPDVRFLLEKAGVAACFETMVCGDMVARSKPDPEIYRTACARLAVSPGDCIALEDSRNGLFAAWRAGCRPVMVPDLWQPDEETGRILFGKLDDLGQVPAFLREKGLLAPAPEGEAGR